METAGPAGHDGVMERLRRTWELAKSSWRVLQHDRELLWLPVLSFIVSLLVLVPMVLLAVAVGDLSSITSSSSTEAEAQVDPAIAVILVLAGLAVTVVSVFFNGALVAGAHERFAGGDPTVGSALRRASGRLPALVAWALLTGTVGLILQAIRERAGWLGRFVVDLIGAAWEIATFLVVPAVIIDHTGAVDGLKRSASMLKQTWGENIAARIGFGLLGFVLVIPGLIVGGAAIAVGGAVAVVGIALAAGWIALVVVVMTALSAIFQTALYMYASSGAVPSGFGADLTAAFGPPTGSRAG